MFTLFTVLQFCMWEILKVFTLVKFPREDNQEGGARLNYFSMATDCSSNDHSLAPCSSVPLSSFFSPRPSWDPSSSILLPLPPPPPFFSPLSYLPLLFPSLPLYSTSSPHHLPLFNLQIVTGPKISRDVNERNAHPRSRAPRPLGENLSRDTVWVFIVGAVVVRWEIRNEETRNYTSTPSQIIFLGEVFMNTD